jgi:hypothetical protein
MFSKRITIGLFKLQKIKFFAFSKIELSYQSLPSKNYWSGVKFFSHLCLILLHSPNSLTLKFLKNFAFCSELRSSQKGLKKG